MSDMMKVAVMTDIMKLEFTQKPIPVPKDGEVLVRLEYVGVCGSDLHYFEAGRIGDAIVKPPFILGHECAGTVTALGGGVTTLQVGDRVALEPGITCGQCEFCRTGRYNLCPDVIFFATPPVDGIFCEYTTHPANLCFKLPDGVSTLEGAMIEPMAVGLHAAIQGDAHFGQTALVLGSGCIGLVSMMALKARGVTRVFNVDLMPERLNMALKLGADAVINAKIDDVAAKVLELTGGAGVDLIIETTGSETALRSAIPAAKPGGTIVQVGFSPSGDMTLPVDQMLWKELTYKSILRYRHVYPLAIEALSAGKINLKDLVTSIYDFDDLQRGLEESIADKARIVKSAIRM